MVANTTVSRCRHRAVWRYRGRLTAALLAAGVEDATAASIVLFFRLWTFWFRPSPGGSTSSGFSARGSCRHRAVNRAAIATLSLPERLLSSRPSRRRWPRSTRTRPATSSSRSAGPATSIRSCTAARRVPRWRRTCPRQGQRQEPAHAGQGGGLRAALAARQPPAGDTGPRERRQLRPSDRRRRRLRGHTRGPTARRSASDDGKVDDAGRPGHQDPGPAEANSSTQGDGCPPAGQA